MPRAAMMRGMPTAQPMITPSLEFDLEELLLPTAVGTVTAVSVVVGDFEIPVLKVTEVVIEVEMELEDCVAVACKEEEVVLEVVVDDPLVCATTASSDKGMLPTVATALPTATEKNEALSISQQLNDRSPSQQ